jgi:hypothetical protein
MTPPKACSLSSNAVTMIACGVLLSFMCRPTRMAWATPTSAPVVPNSPANAMRVYLHALDSGDRKAALDCWNTADPKDAQIAELQVDMMLAISKLKKAVTVKMGDIAPLGLEMAVVGEFECKDITDEIKDHKASVKVISIDPQQADGSYSMVEISGAWKLSVTKEMKDHPAGVTIEAEIAGAKAMIKTITNATDGVTTGRLRSTDQIKQSISESMGGP